MFADGVYEVVRSYQGHLFRLAEHMARLNYSLAELRIGLGRPERVPALVDELLKRNGLTAQDATVYVQVTRGAFPRQHAFPSKPVVPTLYMEAAELPARGDIGRGVSCVTFPDIRWARCDIKTIGLLPNLLAGQHASEHGCYESLFVRDGCLSEGSHSTIFGVTNRTIITHQLDHSVLPGITRSVIFTLCAEARLAVEERPIRLDELGRLDELFLSCTTAEVLPVVAVDSRPVSDGRPGPVSTLLMAAFRRHIDSWLQDQNLV